MLVYVAFGGWREDHQVQQNLYLTALGALVCEYCEAAAAGTGREEDPYVITHDDGCEFVREAVPSRPPGKHRAPVPG
jgi:hypothetical protein